LKKTLKNEKDVDTLSFYTNSTTNKIISIKYRIYFEIGLSYIYFDTGLSYINPFFMNLIENVLASRDAVETTHVIYNELYLYIYI
jgi:hypothetical protein